MLEIRIDEPLAMTIAHKLFHKIKGSVIVFLNQEEHDVESLPEEERTEADEALLAKLKLNASSIHADDFDEALDMIATSVAADASDVIRHSGLIHIGMAKEVTE